MTPSCPNCVNARAFSDIDNEIDVGVVVIVGSSWYFDVPIGHANVVGVDFKIFWGGHYGEFDGALGSKSLVRPFPYGTDFFDRGDT